jgi:hypothetical protein
VAILAACVAVLAGPAQSQSCTGAGFVADACRKAVDLVNFLTPQLATAQAGGNATLGQGGTLGGSGHVALDVRVTALSGSLPRLDNVGFNATETKTVFASDNHFVPSLSANAAIGIWRGYSLGVTHVGGLDALVTATYLQAFSGGSVTSKVSDGNTKFGYGLRVGLLEESLLSPGVSVSYLNRDLPTISVTGTVAGSGVTNPGGSITVSDLSVKTSAWRITASKNLPLFGGLSAGFGQDQYKTSSRVTVAVNGSGSGTGAAGMSMTRTNMFVGVTVNILVAKLIGEVGHATGGDTPTLLNDFGSAANKPRTYFTLGVRASF